MLRRKSALRQRQQQRAAINRRRLSDPAPSSTPELRPELLDSPPIVSAHAWWWRVQRVEMHGQERREILIGEFEDEDDALRFALRQRWQCIVGRRGDRRRAFVSYREPRFVVTEPDDRGAPSS